MTDQYTPLDAVQREAGGRYVSFAGWQMPIQFAGIMAEHQAVRGGWGVFDVSHMGRLQVVGPQATAFLELVLTRRLADQKPGRVRYALCCAADGTVEDDVLVAREDAQSWQVVVNASNRSKLLGLWQEHLGPACQLHDQTAELAMLAVQGPWAMAQLAELGLDGRTLPRYAFCDVSWRGQTLRLSRTGYTGEDGAEILVPADLASDLWRVLIGAGAVPCGLGARDSLRLEAGMPLYGHELDRAHTPIEAGLGFAVRSEGGFIGDAVLLRQLAEGPATRLVGLAVEGRRPAREGYPIHDANGVAVGTVTSGTFSPTLGRAIAMGWLPAALAEPDTTVQVDLRGALVSARVCAIPFLKR